MSAREKVADILGRLLCINFGKTDKINDLVDNLIAAVKEEIIPKDQTYQEFFGLDEKPQLIQGYTAENWQEIIDGGYLCEGKDRHSTAMWHPIILTERADVFVCQQGNRWSDCRPAQIKGVMRPIFVEPVDKEARCIAVADDGTVLYSGPWHNKLKYSTADRATKYIEL